MRFLISSAHEIYYVLKYAVKIQNSIDNIAAVTLSAYSKKLEIGKHYKEQRTQTQLVYGRIAPMAYARSELNEVGAVTAVNYLLHNTTFVCSHAFEPLHFGRHINDLDGNVNTLSLIKQDDSYFAFNVTQNYTLRLVELEE